MTRPPCDITHTGPGHRRSTTPGSFTCSLNVAFWPHLLTGCDELNTHSDQIENLSPDVYRVRQPDLDKVNSKLISGFFEHCDDADVKRTHLFNGRYENIYLDESHVPELATVMDRARAYADRILETHGVDCGYWFNYMPAGAVTTLHRHDDDDELLSAAYYVSVPEQSGELVIHARSGELRIQPQAGSFIFFYPDVAHEVTENRSEQARLSIGINFGMRRNDTAA